MFSSKPDWKIKRAAQIYLVRSSKRHLHVSKILVAALLIVTTLSTNMAAALQAAVAQVSPTSLEFDLVLGQTGTQSLTLSNTGQETLTFQIGEQTVPADNNGAGDGRVVVFMDALPWGSNVMTEVLQANNIPYDTYESSMMGAVDLSQYEVVFIPADQPASFYENYNTSYERFESYVRNGGFLWVSTNWGHNGGQFIGSQLPGGTTIAPEGRAESFNNVLDPNHPIMNGIPNPFYGTAASGPWFVNLYPETHVIATGQITGMPTLIEYDHGAGRVLAFAQYLEWGYEHDEAAGQILQNSIPYAYSFEPFVDVSWLSEDIVSGSVAPGGSQTIQVSVDASGLEPGTYEAVLIIVTDDPSQPSIEVPVTLTVGMYSLAVNVGNGTYIDQTGDIWVADQAYTTGSWGYVGDSRTRNTRKSIAGTEDDLLYQSQRLDMEEYRFDGLAPGIYQVELYFAELKNTKPGRHLFDVQLEEDWLIASHDIAAEAGSFTADHHTYLVHVTDGTLNIVFSSHKGAGVPVLNAIRITEQSEP